jgi:hypothetical protein
VRKRLRRFWSRHRTLLWTLHSFWALGTGVAVIFLARERYGFVPWTVAFLLLTWLSTMFFGRKAGGEADEGPPGLPSPPDGEVAGAGVLPPVPDLRTEATSYVTRTMYQETMFFLIPFYAYSTVIHSPNVLFMVVLGGLALLSCLDLLFDRWLRTSPVMSLVFFSVVAFAAVNLLLPILLPIDPTLATRIAAVAAVASSIPIALRGSRGRRWGLLPIGGVAVALLTVGLAFPRLVPPVPLRLERAVFSADFDRRTLTPSDALLDGVDGDELHGALFLLMEVFAPTVVPTEVTIRWERDGVLLRVSREIEIVAHDLGFRVWDAWSPESGEVPPGLYEVTLVARDDRFFGSASVLVGPG